MKCLKKLIITGIVIGSVVVGVSFAKKMKDPDHIANRISHKLELNTLQRAELFDIVDLIADTRADFRRERRDFKEQIIEMLSEPTVDEQALVAFVNRKTTAIDNVAPQFAKEISEFVNSLDRYQKRQVRERLSDDRWSRHF